MILEKISIALLVMFLCTLIHAVFMIIANYALDRRLARIYHTRRPIYHTVLIWLLIMWMFLGICIQASLWGLVYLHFASIPQIPDIHTALYFSMVTYTSLGYGDIVLTGDWRALSAIEAANGLIIFGWTTALIFTFIQKIQKRTLGMKDENSNV